MRLTAPPTSCPYANCFFSVQPLHHQRNAHRTISVLQGFAFCCVSFLLVLTTCIASPAQTYSVLLDLNGTDGYHPNSPLIQGVDGNLYGTTGGGGANDNGTVFKITPSGTITTLYSFCAQSNCTDGEGPNAGLILGTDGNFYGTTIGGGTGTTYCGGGCGTAFKITAAGVLTTLHSFCIESTCLDGYQPVTPLVEGTDGNYYGTTQYGGGTNAQGTVFEMTPGGTVTTLYAFCTSGSCTDGQGPRAGLIQATNGAFYGTTPMGGANGYGEVFKITSSGTLTVLHSFDETDGYGPTAPLTQASNGTFYGTTSSGGTGTACDEGCGTIFKMTASGTLTTLVNFDSTNGTGPDNALFQADNGNFYGTTGEGGANEDAGTIYEMTPAGTLSTLYNFCSEANCIDGVSPYGIMQAPNGVFYGTAGGGSSSEGLIFTLKAGLHGFVETVPTSGKIGSKVTILGDGLTGATAVAFNGTTATFTVVSATEITATVPTGTTTGKVVVTTSSGTKLSTVQNFRIL
jgi:uncharacterized repeat protein (TIGR03803 family)